MSARCALVEYTDADLPLAPEDVAMLGSQLRQQISVIPTGADGLYRVNCGPNVGVVRLPSGITLDLLPKVSLFNVMWMLGEVERLGDMDIMRLSESVTIRTFDDLLEPIARVFVDEVNALMQRGLYRAYVEQSENLTAVRGRINFRENLNHNLVLRHRTWCDFTEFDWDVPENQIIRQVVYLLAGWPFSSRLVSQLMALDRQMGDVRRTHFHAKDVDRLSYSRQSEHYRGIHRLCRLFLEGFSLSEGIGESPFHGFLIDMNVLFERFVALKIDRHIIRRWPGWTLRTQYVTSLDRAGRAPIRPDLVLMNGDRAMLVADTKYKRIGTGEHKHGDLYQMLAYCIALDVRDSTLIYPRHLVDVETHLDVRFSDVTIRERSINLQDTRDAIDARIADLTDALVARAEPAVV